MGLRAPHPCVLGQRYSTKHVFSFTEWTQNQAESGRLLPYYPCNHYTYKSYLAMLVIIGVNGFHYWVSTVDVSPLSPSKEFSQVLSSTTKDWHQGKSFLVSMMLKWPTTNVFAVFNNGLLHNVWLLTKNNGSILYY